MEATANAPKKADTVRQESKRNKNRQLNRHLGEVLAQWASLKEKSKQYHLKEATKHKNLKNAQLLLDLVKPNSLAVSQ